MPCPSASSLKMHKDICGIKASWPSYEFNVKHYNAHYPNIKCRVHYIDWMFANCFTLNPLTLSLFQTYPTSIQLFSLPIPDVVLWWVFASDEFWKRVEVWYSHSLDSGVDLAGLKDTYFLTIVSYNLFHVWFFQVSTILSSREHPSQYVYLFESAFISYMHVDLG